MESQDEGVLSSQPPALPDLPAAAPSAPEVVSAAAETFPATSPGPLPFVARSPASVQTAPQDIRQDEVSNTEFARPLESGGFGMKHMQVGASWCFFMTIAAAGLAW